MSKPSLPSVVTPSTGPLVTKRYGARAYIGVDLDSTLARYTSGMSSARDIGEPIPIMVERVKQWRKLGIDVRVVTARAADHNPAHDVNGVPALDMEVVQQVQEWCLKHLGERLPVQFWKCYQMHSLWDDRAVQVIPNEGIAIEDLIPTAEVNED